MRGSFNFGLEGESVVDEVDNVLDFRMELKESEEEIGRGDASPEVTTGFAAAFALDALALMDRPETSLDLLLSDCDNSLSCISGSFLLSSMTIVSLGELLLLPLEDNATEGW